MRKLTEQLVTKDQKDLEFNMRAVQALQAATAKLLEAERDEDQDM